MDELNTVAGESNERTAAEEACGDKATQERIASEQAKALAEAGKIVEEESIDEVVAAPVLTDEALESTDCDIDETLRDRVDPPRKELPVKDVPLNRSFWNVLRSAVGRDLTRVTMPVDFNEPLSFCQRLCEDFEYAELLDRAAPMKGSKQRTAYVLAFAMSTFSTTESRTGKPFNPLLGETYEMVRPDRGYRCIVEQVSHHPPITALHCESSRWIFRQEYKMNSKFRGNSLAVEPTGTLHVTLKGVKGTGGALVDEHFSWKKPYTTVHNLIMGKLWIDHEGDLVLTNHHTKERGIIQFRPYATAGKDYHKVHGRVEDANGKVLYQLGGRWDLGLNGKKPKPSDPVFELWRAHGRPSDASTQYGMTQFARELNAPVPSELAGTVAPTDSRLRPDQRLLEKGDIKEAQKEKPRLEVKQRQARAQRTESGTPWTPRYFALQDDPDTRERTYVYTQAYWRHKADRSFPNAPDIF